MSIIPHGLPDLLDSRRTNAAGGRSVADGKPIFEPFDDIGVFLEQFFICHSGADRTAHLDAFSIETNL